MENTNKGSIIIPNVMTEKNKILSRALTFLSEEEGIGKEVFDELVTLMDKEVEDSPLKKRIEELEDILHNVTSLLAQQGLPYTAKEIKELLNPSTNGK